NVLYQFGNKRFVPFVMLQAGYQLPLESKLTYNRPYYTASYSSYIDVPNKLVAKGGFMAHPSVGIIYYTTYGFGWSLAVGYRYQQLHYTGDEDYKMQVEYNRLSLQIGLIF
ncbi:MAG: hypothetical protein LBK45_06965, partial [Tannerellaceae bacterium]|nr:hypothetical protein [Tannerellaceae bacterium]